MKQIEDTQVVDCSSFTEVFTVMNSSFECRFLQTFYLLNACMLIKYLGILQDKVCIAVYKQTHSN